MALTLTGLFSATLAGWAMLAGCAGPRPPRLGSVHLSVRAGDCSRYCGERITAEDFRLRPCATSEDAGQAAPPLCEEALGDIFTLDCGAEIVFPALPVGSQIRVRVVVTGAGAVRYEGSADVTVLADQDTVATVSLSRQNPPSIGSVSPDPLAATGTVDLSVAGENLGDFDSGVEGDSWLELDGLVAAAGSWSDARIDATADVTDWKGQMVVRSCGVASEPFSVRVIRAPLATGSLAAPCAGWSLRAAIRRSGTGELVLAGSCGQGSGGMLVRLPAESCDLTLGSALTGVPVAVATEPDGASAWVALEGSEILSRVDLVGGALLDPLDLGATNLPMALARTDGALFVLSASGALLRVDPSGGAVPTVVDLEGREPVDLRSAGADLLVLARKPQDGGAWLLTVRGTAAVELRELDGCAEPWALAAGSEASWAAALCGKGDGGETPALAAQPAGGGATLLHALPGLGAGARLALDSPGDVVLVMDPASGGIEALLLAAEGVGPLRSWSLSPAGAGALFEALPDGRRFLRGGDSGIVLAPYRAEEACPIP